MHAHDLLIIDLLVIVFELLMVKLIAEGSSQCMDDFSRFFLRLLLDLILMHPLKIYTLMLHQLVVNLPFVDFLQRLLES